MHSTKDFKTSMLLKALSGDLSEDCQKQNNTKPECFEDEDSVDESDDDQGNSYIWFSESNYLSYHFF